MKICDDHWGRLRDAIRERGIYHLVAQSGETAMRQMADVIETQGMTLRNFDPLMAAHNMIISEALNAGGLAIMVRNDDGSERCPICFMSEQHDLYCTREGCALPKDGTAFDSWIEFAANDAKTLADKLMAEA